MVEKRIRKRPKALEQFNNVMVRNTQYFVKKDLTQKIKVKHRNKITL